MTEPQRTQKNVYASNKTFRLSKQLLISGIAFLMRVQKPLLGIIKIEWLIVNVIVVESSARVLRAESDVFGLFLTFLFNFGHLCDRGATFVI